jgi:Na+/proline symporter
VILPDLQPAKHAYPMMVNELLPVGLRGLLVAAFLAAFMSTIDTHVNWGASYLVNDVYKRFLRPDAPERHYVAVSRAVVLVLTVLGAGLSFTIDEISAAWFLVASMGAGVGVILILRWFWWRISAYTELAALGTSIFLGLLFHFSDVFPGPWLPLRIGVIAIYSLAVAILVTRNTPPESMDTLRAFYRRARPGGFWRPVVGDEAGEVRWGRVALEYLAAVAVVFGATFGIGCAIFLRPGAAAVLLAVAAAGGIALAWLWRNEESPVSE